MYLSLRYGVGLTVALFDLKKTQFQINHRVFDHRSTKAPD